MKCPHCGYAEGFPNLKMGKAEKYEGRFYRSYNNVFLERFDNKDNREITYLYGCPKCKKLFMD